MALASCLSASWSQLLLQVLFHMSVIKEEATLPKSSGQPLLLVLTSPWHLPMGPLFFSSWPTKVCACLQVVLRLYESLPVVLIGGCLSSPPTLAR